MMRMTPLSMKGGPLMVRLNLLVMAVALAVAGCADYQIGDGTRKVIQLKADYCSSTGVVTKAAALMAVRQIIPMWQPVCINEQTAN